MGIHIVVRKLAPETVMNVYLPGIASMFDKTRAVCRVSFRNAISSTEIKLHFKGFARVYNKANPAADRAKLPYTMDLAVKSKVAMQVRNAFAAHKERAAILEKRVFVGQSVGILFLLRCGEHIGSQKGTATVPTRERITFFDRDGDPIDYADIGHVVAETVIANITFAKTDSSGFGRRTCHVRQPNSPGVCPVCILEDWIAQTRDEYGEEECDSLYSIPGL